MSNLKKVSTNLYRDVRTGIYYCIIRRGGARIKESLNTRERTLASARLHDRLSELPDRTAIASADATWDAVKRLYIDVLAKLAFAGFFGDGFERDARGSVSELCMN